MCGRYAASRSPDDLVEEFEVVEDHTRDDEGAAAVAPDYNMAPTKTAPVVLERVPRGAHDSDVTSSGTGESGTGKSGTGKLGTARSTGEAGQDGEREPRAAVRQLRPLVWGLVPSWAKDRSVGARMINARAESLLDKPAFRRAAVSRRCLVPADGWYEWQASPTVKDAKGKPRKQPFFVHDSSGGVVAFAGVYEFWRDGSREPDDPLAWLTTYAIVTTSSVGELRHLHDRMPLALRRDRWDRWLDPTVRGEDDVRELLSAGDVSRFTMTPVSTRVNDVRNAGPQLVEPLAVDQLLGSVDPVTGEVVGAQYRSLF